MKFIAEGDRHFTKDGTFAEITVDSVLGARARVVEGHDSGPERRRNRPGDDQIDPSRISLRNYEVLASRTRKEVTTCGEQLHGDCRGNLTQNRREEPRVTGRLRSRRWCRSGTRLAVFQVEKENDILQFWKQLYVGGTKGLNDSTSR